MLAAEPQGRHTYKAEALHFLRMQGGQGTADHAAFALTDNIDTGQVFRGHDRQIPIPFGPYLAAAGFVAMIWGRDLMDAYLGVSGLR